jgi:hypothetical protein
MPRRQRKHSTLDTKVSQDVPCPINNTLDTIQLHGTDVQKCKPQHPPHPHANTPQTHACTCMPPIHTHASQTRIACIHAYTHHMHAHIHAGTHSRTHLILGGPGRSGQSPPGSGVHPGSPPRVMRGAATGCRPPCCPPRARPPGQVQGQETGRTCRMPGPTRRQPAQSRKRACRCEGCERARRKGWWCHMQLM